MSQSRLSVQLYTVRDAIAADLGGAVTRLSSIGFTRVEPYNFVDRADEYRAAFEATGIVAPSAHARLVGQELEPIFAAAEKLGITTVIDPHIDEERWTSRELIAGVAADLNRFAAIAADRGLSIGYHNHAFELENVIDGVPGLEILADHLDASVHLEVDTYWAAVGGQDPVALLQRLGDRVGFLHVKDGPITKDDREQVAVGSGAVPVADIIAAAPDDALLVVELDDFAGDVFTAVADSYAWLTARGLE
ncbi:MAG TPA: sugar phosphate isomerase/epimerase [Lacisediminihabitans sp.]|uniref:sugar phosphate isomerase/epimerase family protein n=1 Tax=Lacisediminihabitans sp. TaxID=2787631 RepID=UPI002ED7D29B